MTKLQIAVTASSVALFFALYLGCSTKPDKQISLEKSRALIATSTDINALLQEGKASIKESELSAVHILEQELQNALDDSTKSTVAKELSSKWYNYGWASISGYYAEEVAKASNTEDSWSIAGTTYSLCIQQTKVEKIRSYCRERAVEAFENVISINPENIDHRINLSLVYTEYPLEDEPMKGILMLIELNKNNPDNVAVLNNLGRLAIKTGQLDRAQERLERAYELEPTNRITVCLLTQLYSSKGNTEKATFFQEKCSVAG